MKKIFSFLYSTRLMAILFISFAVAMGIATFIENDFGTQTAKALVYNAWWFEAIMVFFVINFFGNIFRYRLISKEKWPVLVFHLAFLFILIGAGITRYIGYEGIMLIDEGETTNKFLSETTYVNMVVDDNKQQYQVHEPILLSAKGNNSWSYDNNFLGKAYEVKLRNYIPWAIEEFKESADGEEYLFMVESSGGSRHEHYIKKGQIENVHGILVGFENPGDDASIKILREGDNLKLKTKSDGTWLRMADQKQGTVTKDSIQQLQLRSLYTVAGIPFVIPEPIKRGSLATVKGPKDDKKLDLIVLDVTVGDQTKQVELLGGKFNSQGRKNITVNGLNFGLMYGAKILETPFQVKLNDFQLEKYPGSESAASYASEITVIDPTETFDYRIYMNHILDYKGYKFFQASYDLSGPVEQTHLSVNHDFWGTLITYIGYSLLYFGMISILFAPGTRFDFLKKSLKKLQKKKATLVLFVGLFAGGFSYAQDHQKHSSDRPSDAVIDSILQARMVDLAHAESFNKLVIQDAGGRMKPAHTFASELIRKVYRAVTYKDYQPSQVLLSIIENPRLWFEVPFISLGDLDNKEIRKVIGVPEDATHARLSDFYNDQGISKIAPYVSAAQKKNIKSYFDKDYINVEKRIYVLSQALSQSIFRIFPVPGDENNKWVSQPMTSRAAFKGTDSVFVRQALPVYIQLLQVAKQTNDYEEANKLLAGLKKFQKKFGAAVYPSEQKIDTEIAYNKINLFGKLFRYYGLFGFLLILTVIFKIFYGASKFWNFVMKFLIGVIVLLFLSHTAGLITRWYISGHAPWADAYESIIYVAWATVLFGLYLGRKSALTIGAATFVACVILMIAQGNWLDPEIANLQPVLNSWWVLVHVSIIVASYGPLSLGMILGVIALFLIIFTSHKNKKKMELHIKEITVVNEMAITVGLIMLTIGNFLGGMWANESWGRYWGWDPKETWALVSIMLYAFILHMRLIPGLRGRYTYNLWSIIGYGAIMMTYFGVNFYLSGLHSYASGDKVVTPNAVIYSVLFVLILGTIAWFRNRKYYKN